MARYSRVALYHKAQNAAHNQAMKLKQTPFKKDTIEIPEAKATADPAGLMHHEPAHVASLVPAVKAGGVENKKTTPSPSRPASKKMPKKAAKGSNIKKTSIAKKVAPVKKKKTPAKSAGKKMTKKPAAKAKSVAKAATKKIATKAKPVKKMATKKMSAKKASSKKMPLRAAAKKTKSSSAKGKTKRK